MGWEKRERRGAGDESKNETHAPFPLPPTSTRSRFLPDALSNEPEFFELHMATLQTDQATRDTLRASILAPHTTYVDSQRRAGNLGDPLKVKLGFTAVTVPFRARHLPRGGGAQPEEPPVPFDAALFANTLMHPSAPGKSRLVTALLTATYQGHLLPGGALEAAGLGANYRGPVAAGLVVCRGGTAFVYKRHFDLVIDSHGARPGEPRIERHTDVALRGMTKMAQLAGLTHDDEGFSSTDPFNNIIFSMHSPSTVADVDADAFNALPDNIELVVCLSLMAPRPARSPAEHFSRATVGRESAHEPRPGPAGPFQSQPPPGSEDQMLGFNQGRPVLSNFIALDSVSLRSRVGVRADLLDNVEGPRFKPIRDLTRAGTLAFQFLVQLDYNRVLALTNHDLVSFV